MVGVIRYTILLFTIGVAIPVWAVSIYDVIELSEQGYSDEEVVKIIQSTGSVFELTAEDIPRLNGLGVSETVIRAMLVAAPGNGLETGLLPDDADDRERIPPVDSTIAKDHVEEINPATPEHLPHAEPAEHENAVAAPHTPDLFAVQPVSEEASGGHQHVYVTLIGLPVFILRDEGGFQSVESRGQAIASNLEEAARMGEGLFGPDHANGEDMVVFRGSGLSEIPIATVNHHDVHAYDVRSERRVTSDLLAAYWAALLNDYWAIVFLHQPPVLLTGLHQGDALGLLFKLVKQNDPGESVNLGLVAEQLPSEILEHLRSLALAVPDDFDTSPDQIKEAS